MKEIANNGKYILSLVDPDEVFDVLGEDDAVDLFCRVIKGCFHKATHDLRDLKVCDIKKYIEDAKSKNPNEFIIFYRVAEETTKGKYYAFTGSTAVVRIKADALEHADRCCNEYDCDDPKNPCPFKDGRAYDRFKDCFEHGCLDIFEKYHRGEYKIEIKEVD